MKALSIKRFGDKVQGVQLLGDPKRRPEPEHFRVKLPGGDVDITRCDDGTYWVHVHVEDERQGGFVPGHSIPGRIIDGRVDVIGRHASDCSCGDLDNPDAYHVAVRIGKRG